MVRSGFVRFSLCHEDADEDDDCCHTMNLLPEPDGRARVALATTRALPTAERKQGRLPATLQQQQQQQEECFPKN